MMTAGQSILDLDANKGALTWLRQFSVGNDISKKGLGRPNPKDLRLLRQKACVQPVRKALSIVKCEPKPNSDIDDPTDAAIMMPNAGAAEGAAAVNDAAADKVEHKRVNASMDGLTSLCFEEHKQELISKRRVKAAGIKIVESRVNPSEQTHAAQNKEANDMAMQTQEALITFTRDWLLRKLKPNDQPKHVVLLDNQLCASLTSSTKESRKRKVGPFGDKMEHGDVDKRGMRHLCCVWWCPSTKSLRSVQQTPPPLEKGASKAKCVTHAKRVLKRKETLERFGKDRYDKSLDNKRFCFCPEHPFGTVAKTTKVDMGETTIDAGTGKTKKVHTSVCHKFDAQKQTGGDLFDSPPASMSKGDALARPGEPSMLETCVE
jgi:hypothetical protein